MVTDSLLSVWRLEGQPLESAWGSNPGPSTVVSWLNDLGQVTSFSVACETRVTVLNVTGPLRGLEVTVPAKAHAVPGQRKPSVFSRRVAS